MLQNMTLDKMGAKNAHLKGVHYLRNVEDADALVAYMKEAKKMSKKAVMVGGGYIGLEVSANLVQNGFDGTYPGSRLSCSCVSHNDRVWADTLLVLWSHIGMSIYRLPGPTLA